MKTSTTAETQRLTPGHAVIFWTAGLAAAWALYHFLGHALISALYTAKSLGPLEVLFEGRKVHSLDFYFQKTDALFQKVLMGAGAIGFALAFVTALWRKAKFKSGIAANSLMAVISLLVCLALAEGVARQSGLKPWIEKPDRIKIEPGGRWVKPDAKLGYALLPGKFTITFPTGYSVQSTHSAEGHRITSRAETVHPAPLKGEIWIFGCSFTYGWSLNDHETYPWLLQSHLPDFRIVNFAVPGYATVQSITQFQEALAEGKNPALVIYSYASFHDERNTFLRKRRRAMRIANPGSGFYFQPWARLDKNGKLRHSQTDLNYRAFPFVRRSALINFAEQRINEFEDYFVRSREVTKQLILQFAQIAKDHQVKFIVAGIDKESTPMLEFLTGQGIATIDISVDLAGNENRNWPHDSHPNAKAHNAYADKLLRVF